MKAVDPAYAAAISGFEPSGLDWAADPTEVLRSAYAKARCALPTPYAAQVAPFELAGASGLRFASRSAFHASDIVFFHGGGWAFGSPETHRALCGRLAIETGMRVWSCRYRLAPEHKWPAQRDDAVRALEAVARAAPGRLILAGDSAGAALAFWAEAACAPTTLARICGLIGLYGVYRFRAARGEDQAASGVSPAEMNRYVEALGAPDDQAPEHVALREGPPVYLSCGDADPLFADSEALARALDRGRVVKLDARPGLPHGFAHHGERAPKAMDAVRRAAAWARRVTA